MMRLNEIKKVLQKVYKNKPLTRSEAAEMIEHGFAREDNELTELGRNNLPRPRGEDTRPYRFFVTL